MQALQKKIENRQAVIGIVGLGYVGLPLVKAFWQKDFQVVGFDIDLQKVDALNAGQSFIRHIPSDAIAEWVKSGKFSATTDFVRTAECDALLLCVPTPLTRQREPDMSYIEKTSAMIAPYIRAGQIIILESTTYPGTTKDVMQPILEQGGLASGQDFYIAYSPEREDPGNPKFEAATIPKVVGADDKDALDVAVALYSAIVPSVIPVSSNATAEAVKLTENIFRAVNIALVNELKVVYEKMGIDIWEVIDAAKTKPFGFMPFYPGPGLGGHCIPIDPFYLTWKAREFDVSTRFVELAGEINTAMPVHVVQKLSEALNDRFSRSLKGSRILLMGAAYKKNVDDIRESPAFKLLALMEKAGAHVDFYDPFVPELPHTREHPEYGGRRSVEWKVDVIASYDAAFICTDHDDVDYALLVQHSRLVVDTRNATKTVTKNREKIVKA